MAAAVALVAAVPASGKEGARATLTSHVPVAAAAGTRFRVAWVVTILDNGRRRPFGAGGMFVRLLGPARGASTKVYAQGLDGRYHAIVRVRRGGLRGIQFGLRSWVSDARGTHEGEWLVPVTNNPFGTKNSPSR
ncbi:MAG TPA: hypothetical protein VH816_16530 [Gaiellaceae bacterium]